jgi:uncharacterized DUF497 family protein
LAIQLELAWSERKRRDNLRRHGLDFVDAAQVFAGVTFSCEDDRCAYGERRFVTLGFLEDVVVSIAHTEIVEEERHRIRVISFRKATRREQAIFFESLEN